MTTNPQIRISRFMEPVRTGKVARKNAKCSGLRLVTDLGTANIVFAAADDGNRPVAGGWWKANVMRDGIVVDWLGAATNIREILTEFHDRLGHTSTEAVVIIPPGISEGTVKVSTNVLNVCEFDPCEVVDEPVAAAWALGVTDGIIIDIGHGITRVLWLRDGVVDFSTGEPTGGHRMTLVPSGALEMGYDETEMFKRDPVNVEIVFLVVHPTLEKMATTAERALGGTDSGKVYLMGGSASLPEAPKVFGKVFGVTVDRSEEPLFPTPLEAAMRSNR